MRIAIVSDTHGNWVPAVESIRQAGSADSLMFLGDVVSDGRQMAQALGIPAYLVQGNCDEYGESAPEELLVELGGWKLLLCHGHRYQVKRNLQTIFYRGLEQQVDFVLFGHTHQALYEEGAVTLINPGAISPFHLKLNKAS